MSGQEPRPVQSQGQLLSWVTPVVDGSIINLSTNLSTRANTYSPNAKNVIMMQLENPMRGLLAPSLEIEIEISEAEESKFDEAANEKTIKWMEETNLFGPKDPSKPSSDFWRDLANAWRIAPDQAKRKLCNNCEYGDDSPECKEMYGDEAIYCKKFEFVCQDGKTCKRWESAQEE